MKQNRSNGRIPELDGFRVLLIFIVSWYHIWQQSWLTPHIGNTSLDPLVRSGYLMVDGTVLLSAFLLFLPYANAMLDDTGLPSVKDFYHRRIARILPGYWGYLILSLAAVVLPWGLYSRPQFAVKDIVTHFSLTFTFFSDTYLASPIGGVAWTLAIESQMYLLFPWIARKAVRHPLIVMGSLVLLSFAFRGWCLWSMTEYNMVVNQLPSFLDVYVVGMGSAWIYGWLKRHPRRGLMLAVRQTLALLAIAAGFTAVVCIVIIQASSTTYAMIQSGQMIRRLPLALAMALIMVGLPFAPRPLRFLTGNRVMTFLGGISMNYYLLHQTVAVHLKRLRIPYSEYELPNQQGDLQWQLPYTWLCFGVALVLAVLMTYLIEKPAGRLILKWFAAKEKKSGQVKKEQFREAAVKEIAEEICEHPGEKLILSGNGLPELTEAVCRQAEVKELTVSRVEAEPSVLFMVSIKPEKDETDG